LTDSSEEYSTPGESSDITTPTISRPQSQKDYFPPMRETNPKSGKAARFNGPGSHTLKTKFASQVSCGSSDNSSSNENWSRSALPTELTDEEEYSKTPTGKRSTTDLSISAVPLSTIPSGPSLAPASALDRHPSLSRARSTSELQDLGFLPALKHQSISRPIKGKGKEDSRGTSRQVSAEYEVEDKSPNSLARPPPCATIASHSPIGGQYLRDARMNIPAAAQVPPRTTSTPDIEPLAKMLVVCCSCRYFHDMPSRIYECMAKPDNIVEDKDLGVSGQITTFVKCPWCSHSMSTQCCAGYAAVVYLRERLH
jgi:hypothetical protein